MSLIVGADRAAQKWPISRRYGERVTDRGPLNAAVLRDALRERWAAVHVVEQTRSTNADLLADAQARDRTVLVAEHQVAGRGRLDRKWTSPPGSGLTFSVMLRLQVPVARWGWLPLLAGLALHEAVTRATGAAVALKWPNDLLSATHAGKLAGILVQASDNRAVVGIGLNVNTAAEELPVPTATSLAVCGHPVRDRTELLIAILERLDARYAQWSDVGGDAEACGLAGAYRQGCDTIGQQVVVTMPEGTLRGTATGIDVTGRLLLDLDGVQRSVGAGDVEHLRPG